MDGQELVYRSDDNISFSLHVLGKHVGTWTSRASRDVEYYKLRMLMAQVVAHSIDQAGDRVAEAWPFTKDNYPRLQDELTDQLRHLALHMSKDTGRVATAVEPTDHGKGMDLVLLHRAARNSLVNALRLCTLLGLAPSALLKEYHVELAADRVESGL